MTSAASPPSDRLCTIDLLRAAAALSVAVLHATHHGIWASAHGPYDLRFFLLLPFSFGSAGVYLFFVISGFCIHLRWARAIARADTPKADFGAFWKRRLRRLYPAYAVALAIGLVFSMHGAPSTVTPWNVVSHVLLVHNVDPHTTYSINPVFWTLAIEEQLYLLYFVLLWLRRRYSWRTILLVCVMARLTWLAIAWVARDRGIELVVSESAQATWFIWVLGALAVEAHYRIITLPRWTRSLPLAAFLGAMTAVLAFADRRAGNSGAVHMASLLLEQPGWGLAAFITVNAIVGREAWVDARRQSIAILPWLWLGLASYSLYLFHIYVFNWLDLWYVPGVLAAIAASALAYALFERPFLSRSR